MEAVEFGTYANNGMIEIPAQYRRDYSTDIRVILIKEMSNQYSRGTDIQERVAAAQRLIGVASKEPMTLKPLSRLSRV